MGRSISCGVTAIWRASWSLPLRNKSKDLKICPLGRHTGRLKCTQTAEQLGHTQSNQESFVTLTA